MTAKYVMQKEATALFLGGMVGAGIALMLAPRSGKETRNRIEGLVEDVKEKAQDYARQAKGRATFAIGKGRNFFQENISLVTTSFEAGKEAYAKEKERFAREH